METKTEEMKKSWTIGQDLFLAANYWTRFMPNFQRLHF